MFLPKGDNRMYEQIAPHAIMSKSMAIIDAGVDLSGFGAGEREIVRRCVHAAGDFGIARSIHFSPGAVETGVRLIKERVPVFADVSMVAAGISPSLQKELAIEVHTRIHCQEALELAGQKGWTRAEAAVWLARDLINGCLAVIGNAPTALWKILELAEKGIARPGLVIGIPVGFVGAAESKEALAASGLPYITCAGTRGGSPLAAASLNALMNLALKR